MSQETISQNPSSVSADAAENPRIEQLLETVHGRVGENDALCVALSYLTSKLGLPLPPAAFSENTAHSQAGCVPIREVLHNLDAQGFQARLIECPLSSIPEEAFPLVLFRQTGEAIVALARQREDEKVFVYCWLPELELITPYVEATFEPQLLPLALFVKPPMRLGESGREAIEARKTGWFWRTLWQHRSYYSQAAIATVLVNILALALALFTMNVYDRVVPNEAYATLWVLALGTVGAITLEFLLRNLRAWLVDAGGKKADLMISSLLFRRLMSLRMESRPNSSGAFAANMINYEALRDFFTSAALITLADLPFIFLFLAVIGLVSGILWVVPALVIPLMILAGLLAQIPLAHYSRKQLQESGDRQGLLIESLEGLESIKAARGQGWLIRRWDEIDAINAKTSSRIRFINALIGTFSNYAQQLTTVVMIVWGAYLIAAGQMTMGGLIAATLLCGRVLGPLASVMNLAGRWQQSKTSLGSLNDLMKRPVEREDAKSYIALPRPAGRLHLNAVEFSYPHADRPALNGLELNAASGQKIGLIGRVGSGKSTLLRLAAGFYWANKGGVTIDEIDMRQVDPAVLRETVVLMGQEARLFKGSLRENLTLTQHAVSESRVLSVLQALGLQPWVNELASGLDTQIGENGAGLSGGQRQLLVLARLMLSNPAVVLLDEPTSALDSDTEQRVIEALREWLGRRTLLLATHRPSLLTLVEDIAVIDQGKTHLISPKSQLFAATSAASPT